MVTALNLGFPRIGAQRELKKAVESYWKGGMSEAELQKAAQTIRAANWKTQREKGIASIPSNDFSFYDQVLDTTALVGAVPARYGFSGGTVDLTTYFAMARGRQEKGVDVPAMEMTKWFDTNYHYIVPEFTTDQRFALASQKPVTEYQEAKALGIDTRPVILGPVSYLLLGKMKDSNASPLSLLERLLPVYSELLANLVAAGATWVQLDEPCLVMDSDDAARDAWKSAYAALSKAAPNLKILVATYFEDLGGNLDTALNLPIAALHLDLVRAPQQLEAALAKAPASLILSLGVIDGRNIWKSDLEKALGFIEKAVSKLGKDRVMVAPSCSLLHTPVDLTHETKLDAELKNWLAFSVQKLDEIALLAKAASEGRASVTALLKANSDAIASRRASSRIHNPVVKTRAEKVTDSDTHRRSAYPARRAAQQADLHLPFLPTTTIGSFPQTAEVRQKRASFKSGELGVVEYNAFLREETERCVRFQEEIGIDALVHGEFERNDMVEYFGEQLSGFAFTANGWVQSYGSRCVKPPVIYGDVSRPSPMTVEWSSYAQSLTSKPMKGMLTGPVTILQWSFVRDDQPRRDTCRQIALAIRDEVVDLEKAGIRMIQIDEPAIREGLPLHRADWKQYLDWAVEAFRISAAGVEDKTQIHTHMCYSEFNDIIEAVAAMDADVISIETSRSQMELLDAFVNFKYPNEIGPGVYDIHSPRVPDSEEMADLLRKALKVLAPEQLWVNPDCGLKTRGWAEVKTALAAMVKAAETVRAALVSETRSQKPEIRNKAFL